MNDRNARIYARVMLGLGLLACLLSIVTLAIASTAHQGVLVVTAAVTLAVGVGLAIAGFVVLRRPRRSGPG